MEQENSCPYCEKQYKHKKSLNFHLRKVHAVDPVSSKKKHLICSKCNQECHRREDLRKHYEEKHEIRIEIEEKSFQTLEDFKVWKQNMEKLTKSSYIKRRDHKMGSGCTISYYYCHRSGTYVPKGSGERRMKSVGTSKIGAFCPSSLEVMTSPTGSKVEVLFWKTHLIHDCEIRHLNLSETKKTEIADDRRVEEEVQEILQTTNVNYCHQLNQQSVPETLHEKKMMIDNYLLDFEYSDECKKHIESTFDNLLVFLKENAPKKRAFKIVDQEKRKRKIENQARFYSTKKSKKIRGNNLKMPSFSEKKSQAEALLSENGECLLVNDSTDHTYI